MYIRDGLMVLREFEGRVRNVIRKDKKKNQNHKESWSNYPSLCQYFFNLYTVKKKHRTCLVTCSVV